jgi:hypothetical protein
MPAAQTAAADPASVQLALGNRLDQFGIGGGGAASVFLHHLDLEASARHLGNVVDEGLDAERLTVRIDLVD